MHGTAHRATAQSAILLAETAAEGVVADIPAGDVRADGAAAADAEAGIEGDPDTGPETASKTGIRIADTCRDGEVSRIPYPTFDQVEQSLAIQRLQWLRHLPAPRTEAEHCIYQRIRAAGWNAPA